MKKQRIFIYIMSFPHFTNLLHLLLHSYCFFLFLVVYMSIIFLFLWYFLLSY